MILARERHGREIQMRDCQDYKRPSVQVLRSHFPMVWYHPSARGLFFAGWHIRMDARKKNRLVKEGLEAFNSARFYDAHEHWEEVWLETPNPDKKFLQGLIQVAAAFHHYSRANRKGCRNLLRAGLDKLDSFPEEHWGLAIEPLRESVRWWLAELEMGQNPAQGKIPKIQ